MENQFGLKELYTVTLKTTYPIEMDGRVIEAGEVIAAFDRIQLANFQEIKDTTTAHGGFDDRSLVFWEKTKEVRLNMTQGIFSKTQMAMMMNTKMMESVGDEPIILHQREHIESDETNTIVVKHNAIAPIFVYKQSTGEKLEFIIQDDTHLVINEPYCNVIVDYSFEYTNPSTSLMIGRPFTQGFLELEGRTRVKDDITGQTRTGIIKIPKLKLMSDLSMRLGKDSNPILGNLNAIAVPVGDRGKQTVMTVTFLDDDIDSDI